MKIGMQTWGSHGDVRPFLALAGGLTAAGHDVTLVISSIDGRVYAGSDAAPGVTVRVIAFPDMSPDQAVRMTREIYRTANPMWQVEAILRLGMVPVEGELFAAAQALCAECDTVIGHHFLYPLQTAAEQAGRPYVSVFLSHAGIPSAFRHPLGDFGRAGNRLLWWLTRHAFNRVLKQWPDRLRQLSGMAPAPDMVDLWLSPWLTLVGVSPQICTRRPDWPDSVQVCGFLDMPNFDVEGSLPAALAGFLAAGEAPVYMTLGSWTPGDIDNQRATLALLTRAAELAGCRAIIQGPSWQDCGFASSERILYVAAAPHHAIFPLCRAILHHGGAGTTQAATLAGRPSIVVAHIGEQEHWGKELHRLGIAGKPARRRSTSARQLARKIVEVLEAPGMTQRAEIVGAAMREENGVAAAVALIGRRFGPAGKSVSDT